MQIPFDGILLGTHPRLSVALVYEPEGHRAIAVARIESKTVIFEVAEAAICEAEQRAAGFANADEVLGVLEREEADRLKRVLGFLVPELQFNQEQS